MIKFETNSNLGKVIVNLPSKLDEITEDYLINLTKSVEVAPNYSLIALCHREKLSAFILAGRKNKAEINTAVVPLYVKSGDIDNNDSFIKSFKPTTKLLIPGSVLAMGLHVNVPNNNLTPSKFINVIEGDRDAYSNAIKLNSDVYFLEFKIVANNEIIGKFNESDNDFYNPFNFVVVDKAEGDK